ncbi:MAG: hypothetical protein QXR13_01210 [Candidatus Bathyarchaeia archaeon]
MISRRNKSGKGYGVSADYISPFDYRIPKTFDEALKEYPYLKKYVEDNRIEPIYIADLSDLAINALSSGSTDVIYSVGWGIFIHVRLGGEMGKYNIIEPKRPSQEIFDKFEDILAREIGEEVVAETITEREKIIVEVFDKAISRGRLKIPVDERKYFLYHFIREKLGHGIIDCFLADP